MTQTTVKKNRSTNMDNNLKERSLKETFKGGQRSLLLCILNRNRLKAEQKDRREGFKEKER